MRKLLFILSIFFVNFTFAQSDCISAMPVCGNSSISYNPQNAGSVAEATSNSCMGLEHYSAWYTFTIATSGTLEFTINPDVNTDDYDFALYGPNINCLTHDFGNAIRCNYSGADGDTGLGMGATNPNGGGGGAQAQWSSPLNVVAGEVYYLLIDNFIPPPVLNGFSLSWGGTATLTSPFNSTIQPNPFIAPGVNHDGNILICANPQIFDFSTLSAGILNSNPNFAINYYLNSNNAITGTSPITTPISVNSANTYFYAISYTDPTNPTSPVNACRQYGEINFIQGNITVNNATVLACNNNNAGTGVFDLTSVSTTMFADPTATRVYYRTVADMNNGVNPIPTPAAYVSTAPATVYMKVTTTQGCFNYGTITLQFHPVVVMNDASLTACFIEADPSTGLFNLNNATVGGPVIKTYHPTYNDAVNGTNAVPNPSIFISPNAVVYVKAKNPNGCTGISKITLNVTPPTKSAVLKNKTICAEDTTTLDAGPGFVEYEWSTGATTQSISDVSVGTYWVDLTLNGCVTRQTVTVSASESPIISGVEITNNTITISATGGKPPYKYSMDNLTWQDSNSFTEVPRGRNMIYIKDSYDCEPISAEITVPNLVNVITPNNDGVNDVIDYSALAYKQNLVFNIFNRYGNKVHQADQSNGYKWDGRSGDKKVYTGTYWYSVTWNEPNAAKTPVKFSGWILVKNIE